MENLSLYGRTGYGVQGQNVPMYQPANHHVSHIAKQVEHITKC